MMEDDPTGIVVRPAKVGLTEIAQRAGVSEATVSRVLNRRYGVAASTRDAVAAAMRELGLERELDGELVLLLTPNLSNPIFAEMCEQIENQLTPHGLKCVICPVYPGTVQERGYVEALVEAGVVAVVFLSTINTLRHADQSARQLLEGRGIPYVSINGGFAADSAPTISTDDWRAAEIAVTHLHSLGHRRIGLAAGPAGNTPADRRVEGFVTAMERLGANDPEALIVRGHYSIEGGRHAADELLSLEATGIVAGSDEMALGAITAAHRRGLAVPEDVSVVGYDDSSLLEYTDPPLTTVRQPIDRIAAQTARVIVSMVAGRPVAAGEMLIDPSIRLRASTAAAVVS